MQQSPATRRLGLGIVLSLAGATAHAQAGDPQNALKIGYAYIGFNTSSGDLAGPAGTTPPGVEASVKDASTLALVYERTLSGPWSLVLQGGAPPLVKIMGAGAGAALGEVGSAHAWFPALLAQYTFNRSGSVLPYVGAGVNHTSYSDIQVSAAYTGAFSGTSSTAKLDSSWGYVFKVGVGIPLGPNWIVDAAYSRYGIDTSATITTVTPGIGPIPRTIDVKADPGVFGLTLGYRF